MHKKTLSETAREDLSKQAFDLHLKVLSDAQDGNVHEQFRFRYVLPLPPPRMAICMRNLAFTALAFSNIYVFSEFLMHNLWYPSQTCLEELIKKKMWASAAVLLQVSSECETCIRELLTLEPHQWESNGA